MSIQPDIDGLVFTEIVGDIEIPCDYDCVFRCGPRAAAWEMRLRCGCGISGIRLACEDCKNKWLTADGAAECPSCGEIVAPARHIFVRIEPL